jgi:hypothetical protein
MAQRPAPLVPYSVFKQQSQTSTAAAGHATTSLPVRWHPARARSNFSTRNVRPMASPNIEHHKTTPAQHQPQDGEIQAKTQQLDHLRQVVAQLEKEIGARDSPSPVTMTRTPQHPAPPGAAQANPAAAEPAVARPQRSKETNRQTQCRPNQGDTRVEVPTPKYGGTVLENQHHTPEAARVAATPILRPRSGRHRRRSLEHTPSWEQRQGKHIAPSCLPVASSGGRGQQPRKHNKSQSRSRRTSMPSVMGFGRFV